MPTYQFEAMDPQGQEIRDVIEAPTQDEAQATIRSMGYFVTKIAQQKSNVKAGQSSSQARKTFALGGAGGKKMVTFTRQLSILQDAGLPILRSLKILEDQANPGALKNSLIDVCDEIESGSSLSEALSKSPKVFDRLYVNMIKAGEAGGSLEIILRRLAEFKERTQKLKGKVIGAMIYPIMVVVFTIGILTFIMLFIIPEFQKMFEEFGIELPAMTQLLMAISDRVCRLWFLFPLIPISMMLFVSLVCKFRAGRMGWHLFLLKVPIMGKLVEKANLARTTRTLGALVASGVPIIEGLTITRETSGNAMFEKIFSRVTDSIRAGDTIANPMKANSRPGFHPVTLFFFLATMSLPPLAVLFIKPDFWFYVAYGSFGLCLVGFAWYFLNYKKPVVEDLVVNMIDVGEETGELDTMLYKVADYYEEEVESITDGMMKLIEPLMIIFLGLVVLFIVVSLFMPLIAIISGLTGGNK
ncbi:type II secretion system F family protein [Mariniblastus fucicola]|uniref:Type II secretion system protein F n=1 Tax=Mariniblastus fucicola TaxID=980251 RepID=A0A5B9P277_9BACT|nr:type II secretion system F family protein [Mariniblastus fucicola]QEG20617.1 Putative type II secretion system protein F [Mariniblastus fucicola]